MKKIMLMCDNNLQTVGGEQESTKIIINGIKDKCNLFVVQPGDFVSEGVTSFKITNETRIKHLIKKPIVFFKYVKSVIKIVHYVKPEIIHTQAQVSFFLIALLKKLMIIRDVKLYHTERGLKNKYNLFFLKLFLFSFKNTDLIVTTTEYNKSSWAKELEKKKIQVEMRVIENTAGPIFEIYDSSKKVSPDELVIGFAGRYAEWKNWRLAVDIIKSLREQSNYIIKVFLAIGALDDKAVLESKKLIRDFEKIIGANNVIGKINISLEEMNEFYYRINYFVLTSKKDTESFGRTLVEAMSRKVVVMTTYAGGAEEVVADSLNTMSEPDDFARRILYYNENIQSFERKTWI